MYVKKLNWGHKVELSTEKVTYYNKLAKLTGPNEIELTGANG